MEGKRERFRRADMLVLLLANLRASLSLFFFLLPRDMTTYSAARDRRDTTIMTAGMTPKMTTTMTTTMTATKTAEKKKGKIYPVEAQVRAGGTANRQPIIQNASESDELCSQDHNW